MMKSSDPGQPHNFRVGRWARLNCSAVRRILDTRVDPVYVVVEDVVLEKPMQMLFVERDVRPAKAGAFSGS